MTPAKDDERNRAYVSTYSNRSRSAYKLLQALALQTGYMAHGRDGDGFDRFVQALESGDLALALHGRDEKD